MGDWSDYFEDFPEENPANYTESGQYDPNHFIRDEKNRMKIAHERLDEALSKKSFSINKPKRENNK